MKPNDMRLAHMKTGDLCILQGRYVFDELGEYQHTNGLVIVLKVALAHKFVPILAGTFVVQVLCHNGYIGVTRYSHTIPV
jgi:hypothetical protein